MTGKQRARLRAMASSIESIFQVGKEGIGDTFVAALDTALNKRELIKLSVLRTCEHSADEVAGLLAERLHAEPVVAIGNKVVLYRKSKSDKVHSIDL